MNGRAEVSPIGVLFQAGDFTLASGQKARWKIECDALTPDDWDGLALMLSEHVAPFGRVFGVPTGGKPLADAMLRYANGETWDVLVVDDVWTTGSSMSRYIANQFAGWTHEPTIQRAVLFARNPAPPDVVALFTMRSKT